MSSREEAAIFGICEEGEGEGLDVKPHFGGVSQKSVVWSMIGEEKSRTRRQPLLRSYESAKKKEGKVEEVSKGARPDVKPSF